MVNSKTANADLVHQGVMCDTQYRSLSTPIYQTSTFEAPCNDGPIDYPYSRFNNPTRAALESNLAQSEGAAHAIATHSGCTAIFLALSLLKSGDHLLLAREVYGGTPKVVQLLKTQYNIEFTVVDTTDFHAVQDSIQDNTRMLWLETPSNPLLKITDLAAINEFTSRHPKLLTVADNTLMSPVGQNPLQFGIDMVIHSTSKAINGHTDVIGGALMLNNTAYYDQLRATAVTLGLTEAPFESWLVLRGIKTLKIRYKAMEQSAQAIAEYLQEQPWVERVYYPGLASHPGHEVAKKQQYGFGSVISFELNESVVSLETFLKDMEFIKFSFSFGGVDSIISRPWSQSYGALSESERLALGVKPNLLRLSIGLEEINALKKDLSSFLKKEYINI